MDEGVDLTGRVYTNEELGYSMNYPHNWEVEEMRTLRYFHPVIPENSDLQTTIDFSTYRPLFGVNLVGASPLTYIDGVISYNIEKHVYLNNNDFTARQWYEVAVLVENYGAKKISEADFIRISNRLIEREEYISEDERVFDPWMSQGELKKTGKKEFLSATRVGGSRYDGYQYYVVTAGDYVFVFNFGYGGPVIPREMWKRSDGHINDMIRSLTVR